VHCPVSDETLFLSIDGIERSPEFLTAARLHLGEDKCLPIPADQINFTTARCPEISPENLPAPTPHMECSLLLPPTSEGEMGFRNRRRAGRPAQNRGDAADKVHTPLT